MKHFLFKYKQREREGEGRRRTQHVSACRCGLLTTLMLKVRALVLWVQLVPGRAVGFGLAALLSPRGDPCCPAPCLLAVEPRELLPCQNKLCFGAVRADLRSLVLCPPRCCSGKWQLRSHPLVLGTSLGVGAWGPYPWCQIDTRSAAQLRNLKYPFS